MHDLLIASAVEDYRRSAIPYRAYFLQLFASFNGWCTAVTGSQVDTVALRSIMKKPEVWRYLFEENIDSSLLTVTRKLYILTRVRPLALHRMNTAVWQGMLKDPYDWEGLIWLWYTVRCHLSHGSLGLAVPSGELIVRYAYESLYIFMTEIVRRIVSQRTAANPEYIRNNP